MASGEAREARGAGAGTRVALQLITQLTIAREVTPGQCTAVVGFLFKAPVMRLPDVRFTVRRLMAAVVVVAVGIREDVEAVSVMQLDRLDDQLADRMLAKIRGQIADAELLCVGFPGGA